MDPWLTLGLIVLVALGAAWFLTGRRRRLLGIGAPRAAERAPSQVVIGADLERMVQRLVPLAWGPREATKGIDLPLDPDALPRTGNYEQLIKALLSHVRQVAPGLAVPMLVPRVTTGRVDGAAGQFVEQDGWVTVTVGSEFFSDYQAGCAVLCHELCHYVLSANGVRETGTLTNERLTDVAIFVLGLGDVFLRGYQKAPVGDYRPGHRLGYLNDAEYRFLDTLVFDLRLSGKLQPSRQAELERRFAASIHDPTIRQRLINFERSRNPVLSRAELIERAMERYERDRH
jgi:hypothetical protein